MINLRLPLKDVQVTQYFGQNLADFYQQLGMRGHNGVDFRAKNGCPCFAAHDGIVNYCGFEMPDGGGEVVIWDEVNKFKTIYYHLKSWNVTQGQQVIAGELIGFCDNTGKMTTGDHLHFALKETKEGGQTINWDNGYAGAINPAPYFTKAYNGTPIGTKDWDRSRSYHRYYRGRPAGGWQNEVKVLPYLIRRLKRLPSYEEINAIVYGGWDIETVMNEGMWEIWAQLKKSEWQEGVKPFS